MPISLRNSPPRSNSNNRVFALRGKTKTCPLELVATATDSPRYSPAGSFNKFGADVNGISGTFSMVALRWANAFAASSTTAVTDNVGTLFIRTLLNLQIGFLRNVCRNRTDQFSPRAPDTPHCQQASQGIG